MEIKLCANSFAINSIDSKLFSSRRSKNLFEYSYEWESSLSQYFKNIIFSFNYKFLRNDDELLKTLVFYPSKRKSYIINTCDLAVFIEKYFSGFNLIEREPSFYAFHIPFPSIIRFRENRLLSNEDKFNITLGKFNNQSYRNIEIYTLRINSMLNKDFRENNFDPIFQKNFNSAFNLFEDYKTYLNLILDIDTRKVDINNLIYPYFLLDKAEILELFKIEDSIYKQINEEMEKEAGESRDREYDSWWKDTLDEMNREAFENDPDNYWNID